VVIDTNVIVAGLKSRRGASFQVLVNIGQGQFDIALSVPVLFEYESVLKRHQLSHITESDLENFLDYLCQVADTRDIFYLWRPFLRDPKDDMLLELAIEAEAAYIVTFNLRDFTNIQTFKVEAITPQQLLHKIGAKS